MRAAWSVTVAAVVLHGSTAIAAPARDDDAGAEPSEPGDGDVLTRVRELFAAGSTQFELGDCAAAIKAWEQAYELAPLELRAQLQVPLANAHICQYEADGEPDHLRRAEVLFDDYLGDLDTAEVETRAETEAMLVDVRAEIERVEAAAAERERELAEREARAREQAAREIVSQQLEDLDPFTDQQKRRFRRKTGLGGSLLAGGAGATGIMIMALALGESVDRRGAALTAGDPYERYARLRDEGKAWNATAIATGVVGGAMLASGAVVLVLALLERERAWKKIMDAAPSARVGPRGAGLELRF